MNLQSILLLSLIFILFFIVGYRYIRRQRKSGGCGSCNCACDNCPGKKP